MYQSDNEAMSHAGLVVILVKYHHITAWLHVDNESFFNDAKARTELVCHRIDKFESCSTQP